MPRQLAGMNVGVGKINLRLPENASLKGKRQVVKSIIGRVRSRFNVSVAEVGANGLWQLATIGVSYISNDRRHTNSVLSAVVDYITAGGFDAEMLDYEIEIIDI